MRNEVRGGEKSTLQRASWAVIRTLALTLSEIGSHWKVWCCVVTWFDFYF